MSRRIPNWRHNLLRTGGFWKNAYWYDLHVERRMPLVLPMLEEMLGALPPLDESAAVCDLACGTGNAAYMLLAAYPMVQMTLLDEDPNMLAIALSKTSEIRSDITALQARVEVDGETSLPGGPYDLVTASLALHAIVGDEVEGAEAESRYELLLRVIWDSLTPGGHLLVADHVGTLGLYRQMRAMEHAGFVDVDCAWRQDEFFVCGGRVPE